MDVRIIISPEARKRMRNEAARSLVAKEGGLTRSRKPESRQAAKVRRNVAAGDVARVESLIVMSVDPDDRGNGANENGKPKVGFYRRQKAVRRIKQNMSDGPTRRGHGSTRAQIRVRNGGNGRVGASPKAKGGNRKSKAERKAAERGRK